MIYFRNYRCRGNFRVVVKYDVDNMPTVDFTLTL